MVRMIKMLPKLLEQFSINAEKAPVLEEARKFNIIFLLSSTRSIF